MTQVAPAPSNTEEVEPCLTPAASVHALRAATAHMERSMARALGPFGITAAQYEILQVIQLRNGRGGRCGELGQHVAAPGPDITRMLDRLDNVGLVSRYRDDNDRRIVHVTLTEKAHELLNTVAPAAQQAEAAIFAGLEASERITLTTLLRRIRQNCPLD